MKIAIVVPTNSPARCSIFLEHWCHLFKRHGVFLVCVFDSDVPTMATLDFEKGGPRIEIPLDRRFKRLINFKNDSIRNYGFVEACKRGVDIIITLDDDVYSANNDPIQEHLDALNKSYPISWFNPFDGVFMRGFPYGVRTEARAVVSHGVWTGVQDFDAPTTLLRGTAPASTYKGAIPKGCLTPICGMNLAFRREVVPLVYFAPMAGKTGFNRFGDIWMGIHLKRALDERGLALVHGFSTVRHERQSNVFNNLQAEAAGIKCNEVYWRALTEGWADNTEPAYVRDYNLKRACWKGLMEGIL